MLESIKKLAISAGKVILKIYNRDFVVEYKYDDSPLTEADKKSNEIIVNGLKTLFPTYAILSEESKDDIKRLENDWCFIVDPLDGTKEFIKKNGEFTVNIALSYKHKTVLGVIYVPVSGELYFASKNNGSFYEKDNQVTKIHVSDKITNICMVGSRSHQSEKEKNIMEKHKITNVKEMGSSLKGCLVAKGEAEIYYRFNPTMEWDTAAMQCIAEEAGGIFRQMDGSELLYNRKNSLNDKGFYLINHTMNLFV